MLYSSRVHISTLKRNIFVDYDSTTFNYCPQCIKDNNNLLIIKREHQISGVCVCALHECFLEKYAIRNRRDRINFNSCDFSKNIIINSNRMLTDISKHVCYVFKETKTVEFIELVAFLKTVLIAEGILSKDGHSNISKEILFKKSFDDDPEIYRSIMCACSLEQSFNLNSYSLIKPLIYILTINKLFDNYESFYREVLSTVKNNS